jgi:phage terminase Nu1 subunit (DNA packaging protein)
VQVGGLLKRPQSWIWGRLRTVRAGMLVPSRVAARLPHLSKHDVAEIDQEIRAALGEVGGTD